MAGGWAERTKNKILINRTDWFRVHTYSMNESVLMCLSAVSSGILFGRLVPVVQLETLLFQSAVSPTSWV